MIFCGHNSGQELVTDRPDQTESAVTIPFNSFQIETGFSFESAKENNSTTHNYSIAGSLFRYGLMDNFELRFGTGFLIQNGIETKNNFDDLLLGCKVNFLSEESGIMDLGLLAHTIVPLYPFMKLNTVQSEVIVSGSKSLNENFSIGANLGGFYSHQLETINYLYTGVLGVSLSEKTGAFIELFGEVSSSSPSNHNFDGGITYLITNTIQVDLSAGKTFDKFDSSCFISSGISIRYD